MADRRGFSEASVQDNGSAELATLRRHLAEIHTLVADKDKQIEDKELQLAEMQSQVANISLQLADNKLQLALKDQQLAELQLQVLKVTEERGSAGTPTKDKVSAELVTLRRQLAEINTLDVEKEKQLGNKILQLEDKDRQLIDKDRQLAHKDQQLADKARQFAGKDLQLADKDLQLADKARQLADNGLQIADKDRQIADRDRQLADKDLRLADKDLQLADKARELANNDLQIADKDRQIADRDRQLADKDLQLADKDLLLADKARQLTDNDLQNSGKDRQLADKDRQLPDKDLQIAELQAQVVTTLQHQNKPQKKPELSWRSNSDKRQNSNGSEDNKLPMSFTGRNHGSHENNTTQHQNKPQKKSELSWRRNSDTRQNSNGRKNNDLPMSFTDRNYGSHENITMQYRNKPQKKPEPSWRSNSNGSEVNELPMSFTGLNGVSHENLTRHDSENLERMVSEYFDKKFYFDPPKQNYCWSLPEPSKMYSAEKWKIQRLQELKDKMNTVKSKLDSYNLIDWHKHTRAMNKGGEIQQRLREEVQPEFPSQSWSSFYETVMSFPLVPPLVRSKGCLNSFHLCEGPGAYITSLNHYLKQHLPDVKWQWQATTLNPYYEGNSLSSMISLDRFILQTLQNWKFGQDYTGNLMNLANMQHLVQEAAAMGEVLLVTADGSIECQGDPGEQESLVSSLHYCEAVAALHILAQGGSFLLKMFTMYEQDTVCLMYLLCCCFTCVRVFKPATSKEGNSEVYVVCMDYKGKTVLEPWLAVFRTHFGPESPNKAMFPQTSIPNDFIEQLYQCASTFTNYQMDVIETNIRTYQGCKLQGEEAMIKKLRYLNANHFLEVYQMKKLSKTQEVVGSRKLRKIMIPNVDHRVEEGSFDDVRKNTLNPLELLTVFKHELDQTTFKWPFDSNIKNFKFPVCVDGFKIQIGRTFDIVHSSKFCLGRLLRIHNRVHELARKNFQYSFSKDNTSSVVHNGNTCKNGKLSQESELSRMLQQEYPKMQFDILNYKEKFWTSIQGGNQEAERTAFLDIMEVIDNMMPDQGLILQGYPMLTQFNVGIIYMLCHLFDTVGFVQPTKLDFAVVFTGFRKWNPQMRKFLDQVDETIQRLRDEGGHQSVLSLFPINKLCERCGSPRKAEDKMPERLEDGDNMFYKCVIEVNHLYMKEQSLDIISNILTTSRRAR